MVNVNILNNLIKGISEQIPLVNSYYTTSPYESWNVEEVKYGSVSFVITKVNTRETNTTFDATIYYADRLLEDNSNRDFVHSDAATVIQTIVGALNTADEYLEVSYPVGITLFEQDFADKLAGGYAQVSISAEGMGECFEDEFSVPEIIATSAYFTKEEIKELFPFRTDLATIAYTGSFNDLKDKPDLVNQQQYDNLLKTVIDTTSELSEKINSKVSSSYFTEWGNGIEADIDSKATIKTVDILRSDILDNLEILRSAINSKVNSNYFESVKDSLEASINDAPTGHEFNAALNAIDNLTDSLDSKVDKRTFDNLYETIETITTNLAVEIKNKVSHEAFNSLKDSLKGYVTQQQYNTLYKVVTDSTEELTQKIEQKVSLIFFNSVIEELESKIKDTSNLVTYDTLNSVISEIYETLNSKVNSNYFEGWKSSIEDILSTKANQSLVNNLYEAVEDTTGKLAYEISKKLSADTYSIWKSQIEAELDSKANQRSLDILALNVITKQNLDSVIDEVLKDYNQLVDNYIKTPEFEESVKNIVDDAVKDAADYYTKDEIYNKQEVNYKIAVLNTKFNDYYNKQEVDDKIASIDISDTDLSNYWKKSETYNRTQIDKKIIDAVSNVEVDLTDYYTKSQIDDKLDNIDIGDIDLSDYPTKSELEASYYTKLEIDDKLDEIVTGGTIDLSNYYKKSETYNKSEIDATIGNINTILNNVLYTL